MQNGETSTPLLCLNFMKDFFKIFFFILVMTTISSCSHSYDALLYHKPIFKDNLKVGDSIVPLIYFRQDSAMSLDTNRSSIKQLLLDMGKKDSVYPLAMFTGKDTCEVHHCFLQVDTVFIGYGLMINTIEGDERRKKEQKFFPNANMSLGKYCCTCEYQNLRKFYFAQYADFTIVIDSTIMAVCVNFFHIW